MFRNDRKASIVELILLLAGFLMLPAEIADAQLPTAPYRAIDLYSMSAGAARLDGSPATGLDYQYEQFAVGGAFIADDGPFSAGSAGGNAFLWYGGAGSTALNPTGTGFAGAYVAGTDGLQQIGAAATTGNSTAAHAMLWSGTAASAIDLNPSQLSATSSFGLGVKNGQQVGYSIINGPNVETATVWNGSAASAVLLTPSTFRLDSQATATDGVHQVGWVGADALDHAHAALWTGTAASLVDLNPTGFLISQAVTVAGSQEAGFARDSVNHYAHPGLWTGSADSFVDLTPPELAAIWPQFKGSVTSTDGIQQVGVFGPQDGIGGLPLIWSGAAESAELLPTFGSGNTFTPYDIDDAGNVYGIAEDPSGNLIAVEWVPTPEPTSLALLGCGAVGLMLRRRKRA